MPKTSQISAQEQVRKDFLLTYLNFSIENGNPNFDIPQESAKLLSPQDLGGLLQKLANKESEGLDAAQKYAAVLMQKDPPIGEIYQAGVTLARLQNVLRMEHSLSLSMGHVPDTKPDSIDGLSSLIEHNLPDAATALESLRTRNNDRNPSPAFMTDNFLRIANDAIAGRPLDAQYSRYQGLTSLYQRIRQHF